VPRRLWDRLDPDQRQTLLLHELAHLRRRDHWVRCLELGVTILYRWHPSAWWARVTLREAEEQCCDAWVVWAMPGAVRTYMHGDAAGPRRFPVRARRLDCGPLAVPSRPVP
jgi:bla regulator protein blaR1